MNTQSTDERADEQHRAGAGDHALGTSHCLGRPEQHEAEHTFTRAAVSPSESGGRAPRRGA